MELNALGGVLGAIALASLVTAVVLAIRQGGLRETVARTEAQRDQYDDLLRTEQKARKREDASYKKIIADLTDELEALEDQEGEAIAKIKDPVARRTARRARVLRLLQAEDGPGGDDD